MHFTGIGGAGMSGIARILLARGVPVSGSDSAAPRCSASSPRSARGSHVGHDAGHLGDADTLVVSSAIRPGNPELAAARQRGLRVLHRAAALASAMAGPPRRRRRRNARQDHHHVDAHHDPAPRGR